MKTFTTAARRVLTEPIEFDLDGVTYHFMPPKTAGIAIGAIAGGTEMIRTQLNWFDAGLPPEEAAQIRDRMLDLDDDLNTSTLLEVINWLLEEMAGRPITPSSD